MYGLSIDSLFRRLETEARRKRKKFASVAKVFCGHAYSTELIGHTALFEARMNSEEKSHADWMNWPILEK